MADDDDSPTKKAPTKKNGLPPLSAKNDGEDGEDKPKPVRRKKKKPAEGVENGQAAGESDKPTPRRRAKPAADGTSEGTGGEAKEEGVATVPKKKKKKPKPKAEGEGQNGEPPVSDRSAASVQEDVTGSKTSLIKDGTPRKKGKKKKVKKTADGAGDADDIGDSYLAAELQDIREDVVGAETKDDEVKGKAMQYHTSATILQSQPIDKIFFETNRGFKGYTKAQITRRIQQEEEDKAVEPEKPMRTTLEWGLSTHKIFQTFCLFLHGLTAGLGLWQVVVIWVFDMGSNGVFLQHYYKLALPVQCMFYILFALCFVSACDRFDIGSPTRRFVIQALTLQNGTIAIIVYLVALVISLSTIGFEDRINLQYDHPELWNITSVATEELTKFRGLNTARGVAAILGWVIIALAPVGDRLTKNLLAGDDDILQGELELDQVSPA